MESLNIAQEQANTLTTGGLWSICIWPDEEGHWYSHVQFTPQGQICVVAFAPSGPFPTAEIALLEGEAEFYRHHYQAYMTLLPRLALIWPEVYGDNQGLTFDVERDVRETESSNENSVGVYGLDGHAFPI